MTPGWGPAPATALRIGTAEREDAAQELGEHYAEGRLSLEEHHERLERIYTARNEADIRPLFADLPSERWAAATQPWPGQLWVSRVPVPRPMSPTGAAHGAGMTYGGNLPPRRDGRSGWMILLKLVGLLILAGLILSHLPLILIALVAWMVIQHKRGRPLDPRAAMPRRVRR